jgi:hypothetical protein
MEVLSFWLQLLSGTCGREERLTASAALTVFRQQRREQNRNTDKLHRRFTMNVKRKIEVFSAGCPVCDETIESIKGIACDSCEVSVLDIHDPNVAERAKGFGIQSLPAVVIDGKLAECCSGRGPDEDTLRKAGLGQPLA